jgi:hypothetical protein
MNDLWEEYADDEQCRALNLCSSCGGSGNHGVEEDTGCFYTCYLCFGTGNYFVYKVQP